MKAGEFDRFLIRSDADAYYLAAALGLLLERVEPAWPSAHSRFLVVGPVKKFDLFKSRSAHPALLFHVESVDEAHEALLRLQEIL